MVFTNAQYKALAIMPKITGTISFIFSTIIIVSILRDKVKRQRTYHRLLCGISLVDCSASFWLALSTWPIPSEFSLPWSVGNDTTCTIQGFFTQFGISSSIYNASLSIYYTLMIRYNWREYQMKRLEWLFHGVPLLWSFGTAIAGSVFGIYGNATLWCWISPQYDQYRWIFFYGPLWFMIFVVTINCYLIWSHVRHIERQSNKWRGTTLQVANKTNSTEQWTFSYSRNNNDNGVLDSSFGNNNDFHPSPSVSQEINLQTAAAEEHMTLAEGGLLLSSHRQEQQQRQQLSNSSHAGNNDASSSSVRPNQLHSPPSSRMLSPHGNRKSNSKDSNGMKLTRKVANQGFLYAGAFYINWIALSLTRAIETVNGQVYYPLLITAAITVPIQGLPNFLVYLLPRFMKVARDKPKLNVIQRLQISLSRNNHQLQSVPAGVAAVEPHPPQSSSSSSGMLDNGIHLPHISSAHVDSLSRKNNGGVFNNETSTPKSDVNDALLDVIPVSDHQQFPQTSDRTT